MEESSEKPLKNPTEAAGINKLPNAKKPFVAGNLVKSVVFAVLACAALGGTFYLESSRVEGQAIVQENSSIINFDGEVDLKEKDGVYEVNSGHLWGDFSLSNARVNFWVGNVVLIPRNATFDLTVTDSKIDLAVYGGDVYVGFWPSEDLPLIALDQYDTGFINSLLVPQGNQIKIPLKKVSEDLRPLLPTKILKEFKYSVIPHSVQNSDWVKENKKDADRFVVSYKQSYRSKVLARGEVLSEGFLNQFISWSAGNLTFVPEKRNEVKIRSVFNDLDAAIFYAVDGDRQKMNQNLQSYRSAAASVLKEEGYLSQFENYLKDLTAFGPGDLEYLVLLVLLDMSGAGPYEVLDFYWYDVYRGIAQGQIEADKALDNYYQKYLSLVASDDP